MAPLDGIDIPTHSFIPTFARWRHLRDVHRPQPDLGRSSRRRSPATRKAQQTVHIWQPHVNIDAAQSRVEEAIPTQHRIQTTQRRAFRFGLPPLQREDMMILDPRLIQRHQ